MAAIAAAVEQGRAGDRAGARQALARLWEGSADPLHRCSVAHYAADLQETVADELMWDKRALAEATALTDERARSYDAAWQVRALLPSLQLNLADAHRRSGHFDTAGVHLASALEHLDLLPDDDYGTLIRMGAEKLRAALAERSVEPLATR
ncbi:hypothetical protein JKJ07_25655 [Actinoplanes sp. LDG1-01]|uniref:Tetratricopeptide repeat protein n=1 Tax=Paractinoplanes lichenicola TaxID=2802976 RepID=A0ABS1VTB9_9ACTN|nr:hypothetical protein [Actinoplanes lichenicola]MBL7257694.1 hypothetical protein [Actinoplanes lichenicola]